MAETNPELQSSITCFRQVEPSNGLERFLASANTIARDLFGHEKFFVKLPDTIEDLVAGDGSASLETASVNVATTFRSRSLRSTLYQVSGPATFDFNNALWRSYSRITADSIRASSRQSRTATGKKTTETRPNTLMQDIRTVQDTYYLPEISELKVIIDGIKVIKAPSLEGTLYGLSIEPGSIGAEILIGQQKVVETALAKMVAVRNTIKLSDRAKQPTPLTIPFAYVPFKVNGEGEIYIDEVSNLAKSNIPTIELAAPKWKLKPVSG